MEFTRAIPVITFLVANCLCLLLFNYAVAESNSQARDSSNAIQFGVLPFLAPVRLESMYAPVASEFSQLLNREVFLKTGASSDEYFKQLEKQVFDIAIVNPFDSVPVIDEFNYIPLAARPMHRCIVVTPEAGAIETVEQLRGKVVGVASKRSPISFYSLRAIESHGLIVGKDFTVKHHKTTQACLHNLLIGSIDACGAGGATSSVFKDKRKINLRKISQCEEFPGMVIVAHSRVPKDERDNIKQLILAWPKSGKEELLRKLGKHAKYIPYKEENYKMIRRHRKQWQQRSHDIP